MMRQQVNLYTRLTKPTVVSALLSWRQFWICNSVFFIGLIIISTFTQFNILILKAKKEGLIKESLHLQTQFYTIKSHFPGLFFSENVAKTVNDLQKELVSGENFLHSISAQLPISSYLSILSETILPDVWLTNIKIFNDGNSISLKGKSLSAQSVQQFLEALVNEKKLAGYILNVNNLGSTTEETSIIEFEITMAKKQNESAAI